MRSLKIALITLMLIGFLGTQANARNNVAKGLVIGTAVGSVVGLIVGSEIANHNPERERQVYHKSVVYAPPPPPARHYEGRGYYGPAYYRHEHRRHEAVSCRDIVVVKEQHGRYSKTVKTICRTDR